MSVWSPTAATAATAAFAAAFAAAAPSGPRAGAAGAPMPTLLVVPTGIGCATGGYAGDALPAARLLAAASGCLITHPNVMNGAALYWSDPRIHYVEGSSLDRFAAGELQLRPVRLQRIGLLLDAGIEPDLRQRHLQVADGCRATLGLDIGPVVTSDEPLQVRLSLGASGASWGELGRPQALLRAGRALRDAGATAIAVVARFPDDPDSAALAAYRQGSGVDALAGAEAVISHLLSLELGLPCAHAPALAPLPLDPLLDPRAAGEELGHTFLACVLVGLSRSPDLVPCPTSAPGAVASGSTAAALRCDDLGAIVAPAGALGGAAVLACAERGVPVIAVENPCLLQVDAGRLGLSVLPAASYSEAAGLLLALREGLSPEALRRPLARLG
ncbi:MAG: hypothetical protein RLZZ124_1554 [Cyanobacteriota bacterium]